jgi:hypothetical protein
MPPRYSTTPVSGIRRRRLSSTTTSRAPPSRPWSPHAAFDAAMERVRAGKLSPEDAHHLFDELLRQATPVPERSLDGFLAALARARTPHPVEMALLSPSPSSAVSAEKKPAYG